VSTYDFDCGCKFKVLDDKVKECDGLPSLSIDFNNLSHNCESTWDLFASGKTKGVFQLENSLGKHWSKQVKPTSIEDISALVSIIRPGSLKSISILDGKSTTQRYVDRKHGREKVEYIHPALEKILSATYGNNIYQESSIAIATAIAGFDLQEADALRKGIGKKEKAIINSLKQTFIDGCSTVGLVNEEQAKELFANIEESNRYSFNKCSSGRTKLKRDIGKSQYVPTIAEMYKIKNDKEYAKSVGKIPLHKKYNSLGYGKAPSMFDDGRIRPNKIIDIRYEGEREVFQVSLENGSSIITTENHKYPTPNGDKLLSELRVGDELYIMGNYEPTNKKYGYSNITKDQMKYKKYSGCGFRNGEYNSAYTNGVYTEFIKNKKLLEVKCADCNKSDCRLETHHIDGNRLNSLLTNLVNLCASCHKKREYQVGRTKRGEKGYTSLTSKIAEIKSVGIEDVYDIEMAAPAHNFVVESGIVTCNSHGVGYGETSYWTAYAKTHFPLHFCCSYLYYAREKMKPQEEIDEIITDAKNLDIDILTPDIRYLFNGDAGDFALNSMKINFGVRSIKGCGDKNIEKLLAIVTKGEQLINKSIHEWTWLELLLLALTNVSKTVVNGLISVGGCSHFGLSRQKMLHEYAVASDLNEKELSILVPHCSKFSTLEECLNYLESSGGVKKQRLEKINKFKQNLLNPPFSLDDSPNWIAEKEQFYLGYPLSCMKVESINISGNTTCKEFNNGKDLKVMNVVGEIKSTREFVLKKGNSIGKKMCFGTIQDPTSCFDYALSPEKYEELRNVAYKGNIVMMTGKRSKNGNFQVERMVTVE
jgi:hypothetical protein